MRSTYDYSEVRAMADIYKDAVGIMKSEDLVAFDINKEPAEMHALYGSDPFNQGCLLARRLVEHGVRFSGCTVHFVNDACDEGPIIIQAVVPVFPDDTEETLAARILEQEHRIYPHAIQLYSEGRLRVEGRKVFVDGLSKDEHQALIQPPLINQ